MREGKADTDRQIRFGKPDGYFEVPESERERREFVKSDLGDIDRKRSREAECSRILYKGPNI